MATFERLAASRLGGLKVAKVTIGKLIDTGKILATKTGKDIADFVEYMSQLADITIRNLQQGLTYRENFACQTLNVNLREGVPQVINADKGRPTEVRVIRFYNTSYALSSWVWYFDGNGRCTVKATFTGTPTATTDINLDVLILY